MMNKNWKRKLKRTLNSPLPLTLILVGGVGFGPACNRDDGYSYFSLGLALDGSGNLYIADGNNQVIRKLSVATGALTTLAGSAGVEGSSDGIGAAARFSYPSQAAVDDTGNLYVADMGNKTIRKVALGSGEVTTLAGGVGLRGSVDGLGTAARFSFPVGVVTDGAGNLYVSDSANNTIRKVVPATGQVTTLAGSSCASGEADGVGGAAQFVWPEAIASDGAGNLYVADLVNHTVRKVVVATREVTTLAGAAGQEGHSDGIGAAARLSYPANVTADQTGSLYVSDGFSCTVRKIATATGAVTTLDTALLSWCDPDSGRGIGSLAADRAGNLFAADTLEPTIRKLVPATGEVTTVVKAELLR